MCLINSPELNWQCTVPVLQIDVLLFPTFSQSLLIAIISDWKLAAGISGMVIDHVMVMVLLLAPR